MYCAKCDRTEWDQIAIEMGNCSRCYEPLFASEDDHEYYESQAKASEDNATHPAPRGSLSGPGDASRLSIGSGTDALIFPPTGTAETALATWRRVAKKYEKQVDNVRLLLAGTDVGSLPHDWSLEDIAQARCDDIRKLRWQVRDTCCRAEGAERRAAYLDGELAKADEWKAHNRALQQRVQELEEALALVMKETQDIVLNQWGQPVKPFIAELEEILARAAYAKAEKPSETVEDALYANCKPGEGFDGPQGAE